MFEFEEAVVRKLVHVVRDFRRVPVDEPSEGTDTLRFVFCDCLEQFDVGGTEQPLKRLKIFNDES